LEKITIKLGGEDFPVEPLTLGQLRAIGIGGARMRPVAGADPAKAEEAWYDGTIEVLCAALKKKPDEIKAIAGVTLDQLLEANKEIFKISGLTKKAEAAKPGEKQAEAPAG
jgi:hypothetical protein